MNSSEIKPIQVSLGQIPEQGIKVRYRTGECFGDRIEWSGVDEGLLVEVNECNLQGQVGVAIKGLDGRDGGWGYAGYEEATCTWWRYAEETSPEVYREHCMQIVGLLAPA